MTERSEIPRCEVGQAVKNAVSTRLIFIGQSEGIYGNDRSTFREISSHAKHSGCRCSERFRGRHRPGDAYHGHEASDNARTTSQGAFPRIDMQKCPKPAAESGEKQQDRLHNLPIDVSLVPADVAQRQTIRGGAVYTRARLVPQFPRGRVNICLALGR